MQMKLLNLYQSIQDVAKLRYIQLCNHPSAFLSFLFLRIPNTHFIRHDSDVILGW